MTMKLTIELDTIDELSEHDKAILQALAGIPRNINIKIKGPILDETQVNQLVDELETTVNQIGENTATVDLVVGSGGGGEIMNGAADVDKIISNRQPFTEHSDPAEDAKIGLEEHHACNLNQPEDIDAAGMPWDARINPKSRGKIKTGKRTGMWKYIKQLDTKQPGLIEQVEAENKARLIKQVHTPEIEEQVEFEIGDNGEAIAAQTFAAPNAEQVETTVQTLDFADFMATKVTPRLLEKPDFANSLNAVLAANGIQALPELISKQDLIPKIDQELDLLWPTV